MTDNLMEILLVEDSAKDVELTLYALEKHKIGNPVHVSRDGEEALEYLFGEDARRGGPGLVLLDLKLPKVDGLEVLRRLKADENTRRTPVVVLTSSAQEPDIQTAYELGANSYIVKPVGFDDFSETVRAVGLYWLVVNQPVPQAD